VENKYYELIHTRCKQGIDVESGRPITSEGYKEYAYSSELTNQSVDIAYLVAAVRKTCSHTDPGYMQDAYVYHAPEPGNLGFMLNFHPIPWDKDFANPSFSNRPGNFVNQLIIGDFSKEAFYPYELFDDKNIWTAQQKGYDHYYVTPPTDIPTRQISAKKYDFVYLRNFITGERQELLKKAVAFLMDQFAKVNHKERKFLAIREHSTENIEMWIRAIQSAFSPRMAAQVSFATRMTRFDTSNRYTVNKENRYQVRMNLQDPNQFERYHAMIVGVDDADKTSPAVRPVANSPFVLLDGVENTINYEADTSVSYFDLITRFDATHENFCRVIAQSYEVLDRPCKDICRLFALYDSQLMGFGAQDLVEGLLWLSGLRPISAHTFADIWVKAKAKLPDYLKTEPEGALRLAQWLIKESATANQPNAEQQLIELITATFSDILFTHGNVQQATSLWNDLRGSNSGSHIAKLVAGSIGQYKFRPTGTDIAIRFIAMYLECAKIANKKVDSGLTSVVEYALESCRAEHSPHAVGKVIQALPYAKEQALSYAISVAAFSEALVSFVIDAIVVEFDITSSGENVRKFSNVLIKNKQGAYIANVLLHRFSRLDHKTKKDYLAFIDEANQYDKHADTSLIYKAIDSELAASLFDAGLAKTAHALIMNKRNTPVPNAAHIFALNGIAKNSEGEFFLDQFNAIGRHNFPSVSDPKYVSALVAHIANIKIRQSKDRDDFLRILANNIPAGYFKEFATIVFKNAAKDPSPVWWNNLVAFAHNTRGAIDSEFKSIVMQEQNPKTLVRLQEKLTDDRLYNYFGNIIAAGAPAKSGLFSRIFKKK